MKILLLLCVIAIAALAFDNHSQRSLLAASRSDLQQITKDFEATQPKHGPRQSPLPMAWGIPRTITTTNGQVFPDVTIRGLAADGGVIINLGPNAIKVPNGSLNAKTMQEILASQPPQPKAQIIRPQVETYQYDPGPPAVSRMQRIGGG